MHDATLGVSAAVYDGELYDALNTDASDLPFYERRCRNAGGPVLELCCGTGRLTVPLALAGIPITGLDFTASMLDRARRKAAAAAATCTFVEGDMREFSLEQRFSLVFIPFNSLQNTYTVDDVERVFACVNRHLEPNGTFVFDVFNPDIALMVERRGPPAERYRGRLDDGREVVVAETCHYDAATQVNRVTWYHRVGDERFEGRLDMRCFFPLELEALLRWTGWTALARFGDFDEQPFSSGSPKQIFVCRSGGPGWSPTRGSHRSGRAR